MSKYYLLQDAERCIGCLACELHCKTNKNLPVGPALCKNMSVGPVEVKAIPRVRFVFMPCFHCEEPWCLNVCPSGAIQRRGSDGIVFIEPSLCIGCKSCITACPWGACQWNPTASKAVKCDYCKDRVDAGLKPACVTKCLTQCLDFGVAEKLPDHRRQRFAATVASDAFSPAA
ncbi:MAG: 4Fe-4S dicluster domain-containing protein [Desulfarculus sp.]|jgi:Fe-S-cluster-containing dehydrogenase component|nr:MAG: 4Fe-4S dicluster domain-containing protein [Desulfarculus sp.]